MTLPRNANTDVLVRIDNRVRLLATLLALTSHPRQAQRRNPHGTHPHARACQKQLASYSAHEAVTQLQHLLDRNVPLEAIFAQVMRSPVSVNDPAPDWLPPDWDHHLRAFERDGALAAWRQAEVGAWEQSREQTARVFDGVFLKPFFKPFFGDLNQHLIVMPNIAYPADMTLALSSSGDLVCIVPPRLAWGDNPPWPFDEDAAHIYSAAVSAFARLLIADCVRANANAGQFDACAQLITAGLVALYFEDRLSPAEAKAYVLMQRKVSGMDALPAAIDGLRAYRADYERGQAVSLLDLLQNVQTND